MPDTITILSLGAGVQSTALALMAADGLIEMPVAAIFADTRDEPEEIYIHVERLRGMVPFPVHVVREGGGLGADFLAALRGEKNRASQPPFYVRAPELTMDEIAAILAEPEPPHEEWEVNAINQESGDLVHLFDVKAKSSEWIEWSRRRRKALNQDAGGMLWRACTRDYKIAPIRREIRKIMVAHGAKHARSVIGISTDERQRENVSGVKFITNVHPLLDMGWSRQKCEAWLKERHGMKIPKSACVYCPYRSNAGWARMKLEQPVEFERACQFDEAIREAQGKKMRGAGITGQLFVHRSFTPLRTANFENMPGQLDFGFEQECDGMCGH